MENWKIGKFHDRTETLEEIQWLIYSPFFFVRPLKKATQKYFQLGNGLAHT